MQRHAVHDGRHAELAHAVVDVAPAVAGAVGLEAQRGRVAGVRQVRAGQVGTAAQQLGQCGGEGFERDLAGLAAGHRLGLGVGSHCGVHRGLGPAARQVAAEAAHQLGGELRVGRTVGRETLVPRLLRAGATGLGVPVRIGVFGDDEGFVRPAECRTCQRDLFGAQGLAVCLGGAGAVGRTLADGGLAADQGGPVGQLGECNLAVDGVHIVPIDRAHHVPAIRLEAPGRVVNEPGRHLAVDRDAVVVVEGDQLVELPGTGQRAGLVAHAFHQATVAEEHIGVVVDHGMAGAVELARQQLLSQRHAHGVGQTLPQRAGGGLHAGRDADLGMARCLAVQLAEAAQLAHRQVVAAEVQQRVDQHRAVPIGEHETVAVGPARVGRVVLQVPAPERDGDLGHAHRRARVTRVRLLHGIHGQCPDGIGHQRRLGLGEGGGHAAPCRCWCGCGGRGG